MEKQVLEAKRRWDLGKNGSYRLRKEGWLPAVMYGIDQDTVPLCVDLKIVDRLLHTHGGRNRTYLLQMDDKKQKEVLIKDFQLDPIRDELLHVDFLAVSSTRKVTVKVPFETVGTPVGAKTFGGMLVVLVREIPVECYPQDIPEIIQMDVSELNIGQSLKIKDIQFGDKVKTLMDPDVNLAHVEITRVTAAAETPAEGEAEAEEKPETEAEAAAEE